MKKLLLFLVVIMTVISTKSQTIVGDFIDINNIKARVNADGSLFNDYGSAFNQGFEAPKGSGKHTFMASGLWIGGIDAGTFLKVAGQTYRQIGTDFFTGPLTATGTTTPTIMNAFNRVWKLSICDINNYSNWILGGQVGPNPIDSTALDAITTWPTISPGGGALAPYADLNTNGIYEPSLGDYPLIKGDQAIFFVYNDNGGAHTETGGATLKVEIQGMLYAYNCASDSALYNTVFTNYKIVNKSSITLDSVFIENWSDPDIGFAGDDYVACNVTRGMYYGYNGTLLDDGPPFSSQAEYGANPPAQAVVFLAGPFAYPNGFDDPASSTPNGANYGDGIIDNERLGMSKFLYYNNNPSVTGNPYVSADFYNYMAGDWKDSTSLTYGGTGYATGVNCDFMFPGTSDPLGFGTNMIPQAPWDETIAGNTPSDRRGMGAYGPFIFQPGDVREIDFAYVFGRATSGGNLASVTVMQERVDSVRQKFKNGITGCGCTSLAGINNLSNDNSFSIYPNPSSDNITINFTSASKNISVKIYDATGKLVKNMENLKAGESSITISELENGLYLINLQDGNNSVTKRFIKQ